MIFSERGDVKLSELYFISSVACKLPMLWLFEPKLLIEIKKFGRYPCSYSSSTPQSKRKSLFHFLRHNVSCQAHLYIYTVSNKKRTLGIFGP